MTGLFNKESGFRRVMVCSDFSASSDMAFDFGLKLCQASKQCQLILLHVLPESDAQFWKTYIYEVDDVDNKARQVIDEKVNMYRKKIPESLDFRVEIRMGKTIRQILDTAREMEVDLIIIGRSSDHAIQKPFFGNITEKVCRQSPCAVLVLPMSHQ